MKIIGVLGDIGSGKSFVSKKFNCPVSILVKENSRANQLLAQDIQSSESLFVYMRHKHSFSPFF